MTDGVGFTIIHRDEMERTGNWTLARRTLGVNAFGINMVEIEPGDGIPEHDEIDRDQEEVFCVLSGHATLVIDGAVHPAPEGTLARVDPPRGGRAAGGPAGEARGAQRRRAARPALDRAGAAQLGLRADGLGVAV